MPAYKHSYYLDGYYSNSNLLDGNDFGVKWKFDTRLKIITGYNFSPNPGFTIKKATKSRFATRVITKSAILLPSGGLGNGAKMVLKWHHIQAVTDYLCTKPLKSVNFVVEIR